MSDIDTGTPAAEPADDIRSMLNDAIAETETPATAASEADAATEGDAKPAARARGADGKFAAAEGGDQGAVATADGQATAVVDDATAAAAAAEPPKGTEPPANWSEADKATFKTLPEAAQGFVMKRYKDMEADYTRKTQAVAEFKREYEPVDQMFAQHRQALQQAGLTPGKIIQAWGQVERDLTEGRGIDIIKGIVDQPAYKIDKAKLAAVLGLTAQDAAAPSGQQPGTAVAPNGAVVDVPPAVRAELDQLRQRFAQQDQQEQDRQNQAHEARLAESNSRIETFLAEKDASGAPAYPHFTTLERDMAVLATAARAAGQPVPALKDLYEQAAWANPSTRAEMLAAQQSSATKKAQDDARAKAAAARKAGSSVTGAPATGQPLKPASGDLSLRQLLEQNAADADV